MCVTFHCFDLQRATHVKMTDGKGADHLSVDMTTDTVVDVIQTTASNFATSSSSRGINFYFRCAVVVIGVVGTVANALILYAMVASKQHKKQALIFNQNSLDFLCCLFLVITYTLKVSNNDPSGSYSYGFCMLIRSDNLIWCVIFASKANIVFITIERYMKVVYSIWSKKNLHKWMIYSAVALAWIIGFVHNNALLFATSGVVNGRCYTYSLWKNRASQMAYVIWYVLAFYVIVLIIFIFCYWHILKAIRRQAQVMAGHGTSGPSSSQTQSHQIQSNVIKTMILVSALYAISDFLMFLYILQSNIYPNARLPVIVYYISMFMSFFYFCSNPFIYAIKFDPVKRVLLRLIPWKKNSVEPIEIVQIATCRGAGGRIAQTRD